MELQEQTKNSKPWLFQKGQSGNPAGRPKGSFSLKEYARRYLMNLTDEEKEEFMEGLPKEIIWKMAEGNPKQDTEIDAKVEEKRTLVIVRDNGSSNQTLTEANASI